MRVLCADCHERGRRRPATNLAWRREYPGAQPPLCDDCSDARGQAEMERQFTAYWEGHVS